MTSNFKPPLTFHLSNIDSYSIFSVFSLEMHGICRNQLKTGIPIKHFGGKWFKNHFFGCIFSAILVLEFVICGICEEFSMVSIPIGFEISGYERKSNWVSENGVFAFGFLDDYLENDDGFVVGIWYNLGSTAASVPVWTVGGGVRVSENSTIRLSNDGSLILLDNLNGLVVWNSDTSNLGVQTASLLDNGNLVLMGNGKKILWQSFSSPTNTLLPGQSMRFPQSLRAPSMKSISSYYNLVIRRSGRLALVWENNVTYWSSHLSSTVVAQEARFEPNGVFGLVDTNGSMVWFKSSEDYREPSVTLRHLRIDPDGNLRIYSWYSILRSWKMGWQAVENQCNVFGSCGLYSVCGYNTSGPICDCLFQDSVNREAKPLGVGSRSYGCMKMVDLRNCKMGTSMSTLKHTVLYGLYPPHDINIMLNQEACKEFCANDTSCVAATTMNDGSGHCTIKRTGFISGYQDASASAVSFLKMCLVPQAVNAQDTNPHTDEATTTLPSGHSVPQMEDWKNFTVAVLVVVVLSGSIFLMLEIVVFLYIRRTRQVKAPRRTPFGKDAQTNLHYSALIRLSFEEVRDLTENFKDQLGPTAFKGVLPNKTVVIAKVLNSVVVSERDFRMVVSTLGATYHRNLVSLKGFCFERNHKILLYEYIPIGSLDKWLFNKKQGRNGVTVNWQQRLDIANGVARALAYLHSECQQCIAHGNLKLENVLLDEKLVAKVTDFGLRSLLEKESASSESLPERDIYMFGQMLLQILIGERGVPVSPSRLMDKMCQAQKSVGREKWDEVERACRVAFWCMQDRPFLRPSIGEVIKILEGTLSVDKPPPNVAFRKENWLDDEGITEIKVAA